MKTPAVRLLVRLVVGLCIFLPALFASATTYYVSTAGSNTNDGLTTTSSWRNIQYAANHVAAGDTVEVLGGSLLLSEKVGWRKISISLIIRTKPL
jgi:hypothetical protein